MSTQVQHRRGTAVEHEAFTGAMSEITHDTTGNNLRVHDGAKVGGYRTLMEQELGVAGGIATLDNTGNVPEAQLGNVPKSYDYASTVALSEAEVPAAITYLRTAGYSVVGDGGGALYKRVSSAPSHAGKVQSADGAWWEYVPENGRINAKCFGAKGDNSSNDTTALNNAIGAVNLGLGHTIFIPAGRYLVFSTLGYTNTTPGTAGIAIEGEDPTTTILVYSGSGDCISFTMGANTYRDTNRVAIRKLGILAANTKPNATGSAISVYRSAVSSVTPGNLFEDLYIWQDQRAWANGIYQSNSQESWFNRLYIMLINNEQGSAIRIENSATQSSFGVFFKDCSFNGGQYGIYATGWVETVVVDGCLIVGQVRPIFLDASTVSVGNPHFTMTNCHVNAKEHTIYTAKWRTIFIAGCDIYSGVGSGDTAGKNIICSNASYVKITGSKLDNGAAGSFQRDGISFDTVSQYQVTGCSISNISGTGISISGAPSVTGTLSDNIIEGFVDGTPNGTGIYAQGTAGATVASGNIIDYFAVPISFGGSNCIVSNNLARNCTSSFSNTGSGSITVNNIG